MLKILGTITKIFTCPGNQLPGICASLVHVIPLYVRCAKPTLTSLLNLSCSYSRKQCQIIKPNLTAELIDGI